jgi:hypothetical protein
MDDNQLPIQMDYHMPVPRDPRWVLICETGEYSTLGRHREPDEDEIKAAEIALVRAGRSGWLAIMSHSAHSRSTPELLMVRPLCTPSGTFDAAVDAFRRRNLHD